MENNKQAKQAKIVYQNFDNRWRDFKKHNPISRIVFYFMDRAVIITLVKISPKSILDIGCGIGRSMSKFKNIGFKVVGIDNSPSSIIACESKGFKVGEDIIKMDASHLDFNNGSFEVVFSEGLLEHFENYQPFVEEMVRVSNKFVLLIQPNFHSLAGKIINLATRILKRENPEELPYRMEYYINSFNKYGCKLELRKSVFFNAFTVLLFKK
ncbi:hypothetical protein COX74_01905 [bacterium (Candidatus Gribaldobacteria) CG_4_10_14_0_2_um_filter_41_16]|uniref:Methyltransferase type 11 domain-containing protein n=1 Tax=bacterium (Candidatus Gribaldobacteria) CG_4_10_14_0_2_um_filter_41_16 TaxID=2014265 RepID=A0A2M7VIC1_9BACT|nr:MAG: hypothetical protein COX74_01905 [bacterium (Candidatus Gribaldobacteria) CG_4_10_14_0_2_um_filter_41_16]